MIISTKTAKVVRGLHLSANSVVADGRGGWFVANSRLKDLRRDGSVDRTWQSPVHRSLAPAQRFVDGKLTRRGDRLYVAGRLRVVAVDAGTGRVLWRSPAIAGRTVAGLRATVTASPRAAGLSTWAERSPAALRCWPSRARGCISPAARASEP